MATPPDNLLDLIPTLTLSQQEAVVAFIRYLREVPAKQLGMQEAVEEFMREHSQILELLAK